MLMAHCVVRLGCVLVAISLMEGGKQWVTRVSAWIAAPGARNR